MGSGDRGALQQPGLAHELTLCAAGCRLIAGVDEAGRGAWAGPLVAAAVVLPPIADGGAALREQLAGVRDSKLLTVRQRTTLADIIRRVAVGTGIGRVGAAELDRLGLGEANRVAWRRAVAALPWRPDHLLLDAFRLRDEPTDQTALVHGDRLCLSIAAASIVAKVARDRELAELDARHPGYDFGRHKGYGTRAHQDALARHGPCPEHRRSFAPLRGYGPAQPATGEPAR